MEPPSESRPTFEDIVDAYLEQVRRGEQPSISEYASRYPELADRIRGALSAMAFVEEFAPESELAEPLPGHSALKRLGDFCILREVGRGGMGVVYEALQESLGRHVALKVLPFQLASDPVSVERFQREARVAARLHHTNIVPVFDVGEYEGIHYFAMQFIRGISLDKVMLHLLQLESPAEHPTTSRGDDGLSCAVSTGLFQGHFSANSSSSDQPEPRAGVEASSAAELTHDRHPDDATSSILLAGREALSGTSSRRPYYRSVARVGLQVADGLAYIHRQGLLHRDIKPSNLLLDTQGVVWITDLGLVHDGDAAALTQTGDVIGTLRYMAPERLHGQTLPSGDLYSLGLTLYELLTLRPAFSGADRRKLAHEIHTVELPLPRRLAPTLPRDLETIVLKLIAKDPGQRYEDASELAADLRSFLEDRPIRARRASALERGWRWCRRNRALATLIGTVTALLIVMAIGSSLAALQFRAERTMATERLYGALVSQAQASRWSQRPGQRLESLRALGDAARLIPQVGLGGSERLRLRNEVIACMPLIDVSVAQPARRNPPGSMTLDFDAAVDQFVRSDGQGNLSICRVLDGVETARLPGFGSRGHVATFSPDGRRLAAKYHGPGPLVVKLWDLERLAPVSEHPNGDLFDFSLDNSRFGVAHPDGTIEIVDLSSNTDPRRIKVSASPGGLRFHPDGSQIALGSNSDNDARVVDVDSGRVIATLQHPQNVKDVSWDPTGRLLACACADYRTYVWNVANKSQQSVLTGHQAEVVHVNFNHAGDLLATFSWDGTTRLWDPWTGQAQLSIRGLYRQFGLDDRLLAFVGADGAAVADYGVWELSRGSEFRTLNESSSGAKGPDTVEFSLDGRLAASTGVEGIRLWDLENGKEAALLSDPDETTELDRSVLFLGKSGLVSTGRRGLLHWPLRQASDADGLRLLVGPSAPMLDDTAPARRACKDLAGRRMAYICNDEARVIDLDRMAETTRTGPHRRMRQIAISPDGRWIATGTWKGAGVKIWDAETGREVRDLVPDEGSAVVSFSPDGKWLCTGSDEAFRFWNVGTWNESHRTPSSVPIRIAFSPDGKLAALSISSQDVELVDPATGQQLALLQASNPQQLSWLCFTPDGSRLAVACATHVIQLWDLRSIRQRLAAMGLDWEGPKIPPATVGRPEKLIVEAPATQPGGNAQSNSATASP